MNLFVYDYDGTLVECVGTYEQDKDLQKFKRDNTFLRNLFLKKLPLCNSCNNNYDNGDVVVIMTAREERWWLPLVLWLKGIKYTLLIQRHKNQDMDSASLKKFLMWKLLQDNVGVSFFAKVFVDDLKSNRDSIESTFKEFIVLDANKANKGGNYET
jgi:hypothetical protein